MIFHPRIGQAVRLHYAVAKRALTRLHGMDATVRMVAHGHRHGPQNVLVAYHDGASERFVVVPRGQLRAVR